MQKSFYFHLKIDSCLMDLFQLDFGGKGGRNRGKKQIRCVITELLKVFLINIPTISQISAHAMIWLYKIDKTLLTYWSESTVKYNCTRFIGNCICSNNAQRAN